MSAIAAPVDWSPTPHARRVKRSRGVLRRQPQSVRRAVREERKSAVVAARKARPVVVTDRMVRKANAAARKASRRAHAKAPRIDHADARRATA